MARAGKTILTVTAAVVLLLYSSDCFAPGQTDEGAMECCASMPCTPTNQHHECCKTMSLEASPYVLPATAVTLIVPIANLGNAVMVESAAPAQVARPFQRLAPVREHAPPKDFSTTYHCFLI